MDELLTEQILADACEYQANFIGGGTNHNTINTSPKLPSTNRSSLLKQLSSKLLQTTTKSTNNENVNSTINSNLSNSTTTVSLNLIPTNSVNSVNLTSSNQTTVINSTDTKTTLSTNNLNNSTSSLNSTNSSTSVYLSNGTKINSDQVNCKLNNCSINESTNQINLTNNQTNDQTNNQINNQINSTVTNQNSQTVNQTITMTNCNKCLVKFTVFRRKHQCTKCNKPFCSNCLQKIKIKLCLDCSLDDQQQSKQTGEQTKTIDNLPTTTINNLQVISKQVIDNQSIVNVQKSDDCTDTIQNNNIKYLNNQNDNNLIKINSDQVNTQKQTIELNNQLKNQINQLNNQINDNKINNLSINNLQTNTSDINSVNLNLTNVTNTNQTTITSSSTATKNDFVIISVLKKGVTKPKLQNDNTTKKYVKFEDGYRPGDENIIEQRSQTTLHLPSLMMNANLMANLAAAQTNLTATSQIAQSRISFKPFLAHSQLTTYAQKGLLLNNVTSSHSSKSRKRHLSSSHRHQLTQQKLIQLAAANGNSLRNTAAYTVLTKSGSTKLNQTSSTNKHLINNTTHNTNNNRKFVYLNGKLLVNSYSNYNDFYIKSNDMFQNEKMFTSYVLLA